jgi:hypothetical protein
MSTVLELSESAELQCDQNAFNLALWEKVLAEPYYQQAVGRVETNALGEVLMSPPPAPEHGLKQAEISYLLRKLLNGGRAITECPLSTIDGVRGIDVAWMSFERLGLRKDLYFTAGAEEVWFCSAEGEMTFYLKSNPSEVTSTELVPSMPLQIETY